MKLHSNIVVASYVPEVPDLPLLTEEDQILVENTLNQEAVLQHTLQQQRDRVIEMFKRRPADYFIGNMVNDVRNNPAILDPWKDYGGKKKATSLNHSPLPFFIQLERAGTKRQKKAVAGGASLDDLALYFIVLRLGRDVFRPTGRKHGTLDVYDKFLEPIKNDLKKIYGELLSNVSESKWALDKAGHQFRLHFAVPIKAKEGVTPESAVNKLASMITQIAGATGVSTQEALDKVIEQLKKNPSVRVNEGQEKTEIIVEKSVLSGPKTLKELFLQKAK